MQLKKTILRPGQGAEFEPGQIKISMRHHLSDGTIIDLPVKLPRFSNKDEAELITVTEPDGYNIPVALDKRLLKSYPYRKKSWWWKLRLKFFLKKL